MKKIVKLIGLVTFLMTSIFIFNRFYSINKIPDFEYLTTDEKLFSNDQLPKGKKTVFIYYSTECSDCKLINQHLPFLKSKSTVVNFVLITKGKNKQQLISFFDIKKMADFKGFLLLDTLDEFPSDFSLGISFSYPLVKAFDENGDLLESIKTLEDIKSI